MRRVLGQVQLDAVTGAVKRETRILACAGGAQRVPAVNMILLDSNIIKRQVAAALRGETERVAIEAAYYMLGGSENWLVRSNGDHWWLENRQNARRFTMPPHDMPLNGLEVELPEDPSAEVRRLMNRATAAG